MTEYRDLELLGAEERGRRKGFGQGMAAANAKRRHDIIDYFDIHESWIVAIDEDRQTLNVRERKLKASGFILGYAIALYGTKPEDETPDNALDLLDLAKTIFGLRPSTGPVAQQAADQPNVKP